jgi:hypothetical protein
MRIGVDSAVARILQLRDRGWSAVVDADISACFDEISHKILERELQQDTCIDQAMLGLLQRWIRADVWDGRAVTVLRRGIAQGSPLSPLLANYFLTPLDKALAAGEHKMIRYADDFVILCRSREAAEAAIEETRQVLEKDGAFTELVEDARDGICGRLPILRGPVHRRRADDTVEDAARPWKGHISGAVDDGPRAARLPEEPGVGSRGAGSGSADQEAAAAGAGAAIRGRYRCYAIPLYHAARGDRAQVWRPLPD